MNTIDADAALKIAAASPDPKVRKLANNLLAMENKIKAAREFLTYYANAELELVDDEAVTAEPKVRRAVNRKARIGALPAVSKSTVLANTIRAVLVNNGKPMKVDEIFKALTEHHPAMAPTHESSLRARLTKFKDVVHRVDHRGWWPTDMDVPIE